MTSWKHEDYHHSKTLAFMTGCPLGDAGAFCHRAAMFQAQDSEKSRRRWGQSWQSHGALATAPHQRGKPAEKWQRAWAQALHRPSLHKREFDCCFTATFQISNKISPAAPANLELCREGNSGKWGSSLAKLTWQKTMKPTRCLAENLSLDT